MWAEHIKGLEKVRMPFPYRANMEACSKGVDLLLLRWLMRS